MAKIITEIYINGRWIREDVHTFVSRYGYPPEINTTKAEYFCINCQADLGEIHSLACPEGERYKYFQLLGQSGIPISAITAIEREYKMSPPYAINCTDGKGIRQSHLSEGVIISPGGKPTGHMCKSCAQVVIDEYREKLGEVWTFEIREYQTPSILPKYKPDP